eukprot:15447640-Alexandrium_andersonii.AAC.1
MLRSEIPHCRVGLRCHGLRLICYGRCSWPQAAPHVLPPPPLQILALDPLRERAGSPSGT